MKKLAIFIGIFVLALSLFSAAETNAQNRKSVSAAEGGATCCGVIKL